MKAYPTALRVVAAAVALAAGAGFSPIRAKEEDPAALRERIAALEKRLSELEAKADSEKKLERLREKNKELHYRGVGGSCALTATAATERESEFTK